MRTEGDFIKVSDWLLPLSWVYGLGVGIRNKLFDLGVLKQRAFGIPVIDVGNITVGGSGKTPHVEYLVRLLKEQMRVAVLSRGYKRSSRGYVLATGETTMRQIGDEPFQMKRKFGNDVYVAVDKNRCEGIDRLTKDAATRDVEVILLDDAFQHRYVKPGVNILLVDYHRLIIYDKLLPAGRLREPQSGKSRADIVIVTKCPKDLKPMEFRVLTKAMDLFPYQDLFFTCIDYDAPTPLFGEGEGRAGGGAPSEDILKGKNVLLLSAIASPRQLWQDLKPRCATITPLTFRDHHNFSQKDIRCLNATFANMASPKIIVTTEKDAARLYGVDGLSQDVRSNLFLQPIHIRFLLDQQEYFNEKIISYVRKNSRDSILVKRKDDDPPSHGHHSGHRSRTISFRDN